MATTHRFKSDAFEAIHAAVEGMYISRTIDRKTMTSFDTVCFSTQSVREQPLIRSLIKDDRL
ncbi:hypothetical protein LAC81_36845 (plasmid) [Ensifer adhaerens]|uniref:hypothetical protein n=1 Tax=Ensifer adhaerens TaxID=106592 RepID=UPI001CBD3B7E|nr:hypothetical protein [Ensifer adhaerens]MBZ7927507.1 hypothetical protein [Ensifer adhaerens]UAX97928.1 hypothetical protein LAC78_38150 [Ensifer adhaerens]UAY05307.1 hypothetical protein LAC80_36860 [Ensifer adhaerens]UAY12685.1 hypothetical protein LAC81_36845 [Ensifer adhaerens]